MGSEKEVIESEKPGFHFRDYSRMKNRLHEYALLELIVKSSFKEKIHAELEVPYTLQNIDSGKLRGIGEGKAGATTYCQICSTSLFPSHTWGRQNEASLLHAFSMKGSRHHY